ncbi:hypothetical protein TNCV_3561801 [Trichonephila clavipes]|nr:hypothetical protein TNCV_3561801 [Trichonephila clavipes]
MAISAAATTIRAVRASTKEEIRGIGVLVAWRPNQSTFRDMYLYNHPDAHSTICTHNLVDFGHCFNYGNSDKATWALVILSALSAHTEALTPLKNTRMR